MKKKKSIPIRKPNANKELLQNKLQFCMVQMYNTTIVQLWQINLNYFLAYKKTH